MRDSPLASQVTEGGLYCSRQNIALARSQKVLQSWLPNAGSAAAEEEEDEGDFEAMDEAAGLGTSKKDDESIPDVLRTNRASQDKLLEQLLGKKAAAAKKKSLQEARKTTSSLAKSAAIPPRQIKSVPTQSDDEEEGGRAAAFSSKRKTRDTKTPAYIAAGGKADDVLDVDATPPDPREDLATVTELVGEQKAEQATSKKRKAGSYLDEVLATKAKKKKGKKKNKEKAGAA